MVYKSGHEPNPGPGLWQAFNLGLAQDFERTVIGSDGGGWWGGVDEVVAVVAGRKIR